MFSSQIEHHPERTLAITQKGKSELAFYRALGSGLNDLMEVSPVKELIGIGKVDMIV